MRISLIGAGTRGDAQPVVLLARALQGRGHDVVVGVSADLVGFAERAGVPTLPFGPDNREVLGSEHGQRMLAAGDVRQLLRRLAQVSHERFPLSVRELSALFHGADLVVAGILAEDAGSCFAEALRIPLVALHLTPLRRTRAYPAPLVTTASRLPGRANLATTALFERLWCRNLAGDMALLRAELGLPPDRRTAPARLAVAGATEVQAYSEVVVPGLRDLGPRRPVVGYLLPGRQERAVLGDTPADAELDDWIGDGSPPVYLGFGSMPVLDPAATLAVVGRVAARLRVRALVMAGSSGMPLGDAGPDVRVVASVDHDEVLPRCRAAVHHGGAGTTAAALRAGTPSLVCSVFADQPFWGTRVARLGAGAHLRLTALDETTLERGLADVLRPEVGARAAALGGRLRAEPDAAVRAADLVEGAATLGRR